MGLPVVAVTESNQPLATSAQGAQGVGLCIGTASGIGAGTVFDAVSGYGNNAALANALGTGELVEAAALCLETAGVGYTGGGLIYAGLVFSGTWSAITAGGGNTGALTVTITGYPAGNYSLVINVVTSGAFGTGQFQVSINGGATFGPVITSTTSGQTYLIPNTGSASDGSVIAITGSNTCFAAGDTFTATVTQATGSLVGRVALTAQSMTKTGTGTATLTLTGTPTGNYAVVVNIVLGGAFGTATFKVSLDGGNTFGGTQTTTSSVEHYVIPGSGLTLNLTGTSTCFVTADSYAYTTAGVVTHSGTGTGGLALLTPAPVDAYNVVAQIVASGAAGTATYAYSVDGGQTFSQPLATPIVSTQLGSTGVFVDFYGTLVAGDTYTFQCQPPTYGLTDLVNFFAINGGSGSQPWEFIWVVGQCGTAPGNVDSGSAGPAAFAAVIAAMDTICVGLFVGGIQPTMAIVEGPSDTTQNNIDSQLASATAGTSSDFVCPCAGDLRVTSPLTLNDMQRGAAWAVGPRIAQVRPGHHLGRVKDGPCIGVTSILRDETNTPALDAARISSMRTLPRLPGYYITRGRIMASTQSVFQQVQFRRVMNEVIRAVVPVAQSLLNDDFKVTPSGTIDPVAADTINSAMTTAANQAAVTNGDASAVSAAVDETVDLLTTDEIIVVVSITPKGYAETVAVQLGFSNLAA